MTATMTTTITPVHDSTAPAVPPGLKIWVADDSRDDHLLMVLAAHEANLHADFGFVTDGEQLLTELAGAAEAGVLPDLLVLAMDMPQMNGTELIRRIQSDPALAAIPIIVTSNSDAIEERAQCLRSGACWFETKPRTFGGLVEFVAGFESFARGGVWGSDTTLDLSISRTDRVLKLLRRDALNDAEDAALTSS